MSRGRKSEVDIRVHHDGRVEVVKSANMNVVLMKPETGEVRLLTTHPEVILEEKGGEITVKESPPNTKVNIVKVPAPVQEQADSSPGGSDGGQTDQTDQTKEGSDAQ